MLRKTVFAALFTALAAAAAASAAPPAPAGRIVFTSARSNDGRELYVVNRDGTGLRRLTWNTLGERQAAWSPDRTRIAFSAFDAGGNFDIYVIGADGSAQRRLTTDPARDDSPQWTSDGRIVFQRAERSWIMNGDGSGAAELPTGDGDALTPTASPKGDTIAFSSNRGGSTWALYTMRIDGSGLRQVTYPTAGQDAEPRFSANGNDIVFVRDNGTQDYDLYVVHANGSGLTRLTNTPNRLEFFSSWSGGDIVFSARGADGVFHLYSVPARSGMEQPVSTWPQAPYADTFDTPVDSSFWHTINDPGGTVGVSDGRLVASISGSAVPGGQYNQVDEHIGSQCNLNGDFDYQVDYTLLVWPDFGGLSAQLSAFFADAAVARQSQAFSPPFNQQYSGWATTGFGSFTSSDTSGTFRLVRVNGIVSAYVRSASIPDWRLVASGSAPGSTVYGMGLWAPGDQFQHQDGSVAYDNFRLTSGAVTCPSWWQDFAPDVG
jgi:hypothetical protein